MTSPILLTSSPTLADFLRKPLALPRLEMDLDTYLALPSSPKDAQGRKTISPYRFAWASQEIGYAVACLARQVLSAEGTSPVLYEHYLVTNSGAPILMQSQSDSAFRHCLTGQGMFYNSNALA